MTYRDLLVKIELLLSEAGVPDANYDSFQLFSDATGMSKADYLMQTNFEVPAKHADVVMEYARRRAGREPLQQIIGYTYFMGHKFSVNKNVLIPRYDTEVLVEQAVDVLNDYVAKGTAKVLDMCTGSGCILLGLLLYYKDKYQKDAAVVGVGADISEEALALAIKNAESFELTDKVSFVKTNLFGSVDDVFDMILCNPPYINSKVCDTLMPEVRDFEPRLALDGGEDGMDFYDRIVPKSVSHLSEGGYLFLEIGHDQGERVSKLMKENGYQEVAVIKDLAGLDRVVMGHL